MFFLSRYDGRDTMEMPLFAFCGTAEEGSSLSQQICTSFLQFLEQKIGKINNDECIFYPKHQITIMSLKQSFASF